MVIWLIWNNFFNALKFYGLFKTSTVEKERNWCLELNISHLVGESLQCQLPSLVVDDQDAVPRGGLLSGTSVLGGVHPVGVREGHTHPAPLLHLQPTHLVLVHGEGSEVIPAVNRIF